MSKEEDWDDFLKLMKAKWSSPSTVDTSIPLSIIHQRICNLQHSSAAMWSDCAGWAPPNAAAILKNARLDRQTSLAVSLGRWLKDEETYSDGDLILAWTNLGALTEGLLKLFLCVYHSDYLADEKTVKQTQAFHQKKNEILNPDGLRLDVLIQYYEKADLLPSNEFELSRLVQSQRNAIHAFKNREIFGWDIFRIAVRAYERMLKSLLGRMPYPDYHYEPSGNGGPY